MKVRSALGRLGDALADLHALLAGAALAMTLDALGASGQTTIVGGLGLGTVLWLFTAVPSTRRRSRCETEIALLARSLLDRHLLLSRGDGVGFGDFLNLRHLAAAARVKRLEGVISFGGPAQDLAREARDLLAELEDGAGRCYHELRQAGRYRVDAFAAALRAVASVGDAMLNAPLYDPRHPHAATDRFQEELAAAVIAASDAGDALDRAFDPAGSSAARAARDASLLEQQRREGHAAAVLMMNAADATQRLALRVPQTGDLLGSLAELVEQLAAAWDVLLHVDAEAFREATTAARAAHRQITYGDIGDALVAARKLNQDAGVTDAQATLQDRLRRLPADLAELERIRGGGDLPGPAIMEIRRGLDEGSRGRSGGAWVG